MSEQKMTNLAQAFGCVFDATKIEPSVGGSVFSIGKHIVKIVDSEITGTKNNDGGMLVLTLEAIDQNDPDCGKTMNYRLNLFNKSEQAAKIAQAQLSSICHVTGVYQVQDTQQLHGHPFMVEIGNQKLTAEQKEKAERGEQVEPYKEVKAVFDTNGNKPGHKGAAPAQTAQNAAGWGNNQQQAQQQPAQQQQANWGNQQQQQQQQSQQTQNQAAWGAGTQQQQNQQQQGQQGGQPAWGNGQQAEQQAHQQAQQQPQQQPQPAQQGGQPAWGNGGTGGSQPAWGQQRS